MKKSQIQNSSTLNPKPLNPMVGAGSSIKPWSSGFRAQSLLGIGVQGFGFGAKRPGLLFREMAALGPGCRGLGFRVWGLREGVWGLRDLEFRVYRVWGLGFKLGEQGSGNIGSGVRAQGLRNGIT